MAQKVEKFKRKTHIERTGPAWRSESISSEEDSLSPLEKKIKSKDHMESESGSETDDVVATLEVVKKVMPEIELVLEKLDKMKKKLDNLESYVKVVDLKVNRLQEKVERFESFSKDAASSLKVCTTEENATVVLVGFMQNELDISEADTIEFQRIHRIGRVKPSQDKPRPIIARFLRYSDRELVMSRVKKLKGKGLGISADLQKEIVNRRKELMPKFKKAKEDVRSAFFKSSEPDKLYVEGTRVY